MTARGICLATGCSFDKVDESADYVTYCADRHTAATGHTVVISDHTEPPC